MSIKEDAAVKLNEAYEAALITPHPVCRHGEFIDYVIDNTHLTFKYILFTAVLAKATDSSINPLCLQKKSELPGAYDARTVCHKVVVPFEMETLEKALGGSNEPFLNKPARFPRPSPNLFSSYFVIWKLLVAVDHGSDLSRKVLLLLLDALALLEANGGVEADLAAQRLGSVVHILLDGDVAVLDEGLLKQAVLGIELVELAHDNLFLDLIGLVRHLRVVGHLAEHDFLLLVQNVLRDLALVPEAGVERGDLHGDVLADLGGVAALDGQVDDNADLAFHVDIGDGEAVSDAGEATDAHVLADGEEQLVLRILDGAVAAEYGGQGYGVEAFRAVAEWGLYQRHLGHVVAKCFKENDASYKMLSSCMRKKGEDEKFFYFNKEV